MLSDAGVLSRVHRNSRREYALFVSSFDYRGSMVARASILGGALRIWTRTAGVTIGAEVVHA